ncbi:GmrSD restriction endonuclease domain-containing protein [Helicobacter pylori]|uniref:GmrSD restriction endonuclease domain-containing protein n=1 Tax=Helicobacter pylori TaxID=210 RepID=UPI001AABBB09|nr:DUF262 domain-containing protein [Helicobacter pylori]GHQ32385.1 hypothetical protein JP0063_11790 [Helicobacter pylori]
MGVFLDKSIKNVVDELNVRYFLPDIQCEYVWLKKADEKKIEQLFDSILKGYPIGSFLFWKLQKEDIARSDEQDENKLNFQLYKFIENYDERKPHNEKIYIEQISRDDLSIVLDDQQRLTSLYIGLKGTRTLKKKRARNDNPSAYEEKRLYLNLKHQPNMDNPEDNYQFEFHAKAPANDEKHFWFKVGDILELESVWNYAEKHGIKGNEGNALDLLGKLKDAFHTKQLISFFEEKEKNLNKVLNIFIRVNSGGEKLSYSDLLMSILTASFSSDIREKMNELVDALKLKGFLNVEQDQVLKTCLLLIGKDTTFELKNFNKNNVKKIEENWEKITESIYNAAKLLETFGYVKYLGSAYILSTLAYFYFLKQKMDKNDEEQALKFVRNAQIMGYFGGSTDTKLSIIAHSIKEARAFEAFNHNLAKHQTCPLKITNDAIEGMVVFDRHSRVFPVLQILYPNLNYKTTTFHIDHIYPKSKFKKENEKLDKDFYECGNHLYNLQLLESQENSAKKDKDPEAWLKEEYKNEQAQAIEEYKKRNYIDPKLKLEWENVKEFRKKREEAIIKRLKEVLLPQS